jgi:hypothetical protein
LTPTITYTGTPTPTQTGTVIPPTSTQTGTPSLTPTITATVCVSGVLLPLYSFESDLQCWKDHPADSSVDGSVIARTSAVQHDGSSCFGASVPFTTVSQHEQFEIDFGSTASIPPGSRLSVWVYVSGDVASTGQCGVKLLAQSGTWAYEDGTTVGGLTSTSQVKLNPWEWTKVEWVPPFAASGADPADVKRVGLQIYSGDSGAPVGGMVYFDQFQIEFAATPTPTRTWTPTPSSTHTLTATASPTGSLAPVTPSNTPTSSFTFTATPTWTLTHTPGAPCTVLLNGFETLAENGTWAGENSTRTLSTTYVTQGSSSMDVNVTTATGWNKVLNLGGFRPFFWDAYTTLVADVTVDASLVAGAGYAELQLRGDSCPASNYDQSLIASNNPALTAGTQTLSWNLSMAAGSIVPGTPLSTIYFIFNNGEPAASPGTGHIYIDNLRLVYTCSAPPPAYPTWVFETNNQLLGWKASAGAASWAAGGYGGSSGCFNLNHTFTVGMNTDAQLDVNCVSGGALPFDMAGRNIRARVWMDASVKGDGTPQAKIFFQSNGWADWSQTAVVDLAPGAWTLVDLPVSWFAPVDTSTINRIGVEIMMNSDGTTRGTGNIKIDNIEIY